MLGLKLDAQRPFVLGNMIYPGGNNISDTRLHKVQCENEQNSLMQFTGVTLYIWSGQLILRKGNINARLRLPAGKQDLTCDKMLLSPVYMSSFVNK